MRLSLTIAIFLLSSSVAQAGDEKLWPTALKSLGDCVTARISAPRNPMQDKVDENFCRENNAGDAQKIQACIGNAGSMMEVDFFTDRCGEREGVFYISLNGTEYTLNRIGEPEGPFSYAGKFASENLVVEIKSGKLLSREFMSSEEGDPRDIKSEAYEVILNITKAGRTEKMQGVFWRGL